MSQTASAQIQIPSCNGSVKLNPEIIKLFNVNPAKIDFMAKLELCFNRIKAANYLSDYKSFNDFYNKIASIQNQDGVVTSGIHVIYGKASLKACGNSIVIALDHANILATKHALVFGFDKSNATMFDTTEFLGFDQTIFYAYENAQIKAYDNCKGKATGFTNITAFNCSIVDAYDRAMVICKDNAIVRAYKAVRIEAYDSSRIFMFDDVVGWIFDNAEANLCGNSMICKGENGGQIGKQNNHRVFLLYPLNFISN